MLPATLLVSQKRERMKLISNDLRDGDKLPHRHVFNGMGYDGDNISGRIRPRGRRADGQPKVCRDPLRSRRADRLRLVALGGGEPPGGYARTDPWVRLRPGTYQTASSSTRVPISGKAATAARPPKAKTRTAISLRFTRWTSSVLMLMKTPAMVGFNVHFHSLASAFDHGDVQLLCR